MAICVSQKWLNTACYGSQPIEDPAARTEDRIIGGYEVLSLYKGFHPTALKNDRHLNPKQILNNTLSRKA